MDLEKLTDRARGFLQAAQTIAVREHHQRIAPAHLLKALLDDEQGMAAGLIEAGSGLVVWAALFNGAPRRKLLLNGLEEEEHLGSRGRDYRTAEQDL